MAKQTFEIEIDRNQLPKEQFDEIKNDLIKNIIKDSWTPDSLDQNAWHVKADFSKHAKGGISVGSHTINPGLFDANSNTIERLKVTVEDIGE